MTTLRKLLALPLLVLAWVLLSADPATRWGRLLARAGGGLADFGERFGRSGEAP